MSGLFFWIALILGFMGVFIAHPIIALVLLFLALGSITSSGEE